MDEMTKYLPWLCALGFTVLMVTSRLITNHYVKERINQIWGAGTPVGHIPLWVSTLYLLGFGGLILTFFWSLFAVAWWAGIPIVLLYLFSGLVPSLAPKFWIKR